MAVRKGQVPQRRCSGASERSALVVHAGGGGHLPTSHYVLPVPLPCSEAAQACLGATSTATADLAVEASRLEALAAQTAVEEARRQEQQQQERVQAAMALARPQAPAKQPDEAAPSGMGSSAMAALAAAALVAVAPAAAPAAALAAAVIAGRHWMCK